MRHAFDEGIALRRTFRMATTEVADEVLRPSKAIGALSFASAGPVEIVFLGIHIGRPH